MPLFGLSVSSFFSQITSAILFKKKIRTSSKTPHEIYDIKFKNSVSKRFGILFKPFEKFHSVSER